MGFITGEWACSHGKFAGEQRPARGVALVARASVVHAGKRQIVCRCDVFAITGTEEKLCATAQGTIAPLAAPANNGN